MSDSEGLQPIDVTGPTLEEAIEAGLHKLGLTRNDVIIEIIEEGTRGVLGLGARDARVRLTPLRSTRPAPAPAAASRLNSSGVATKTAAPEAPAWTGDVEPDREAITTRDILSELLEKMGIDSTIQIRRAEPAEAEGDPPWILDIQGRDLGVLIGRHGETLDALQYITRLIVSRELQSRANIVVDVEGYKMRRESSLRKLALNMAQQARQMGRTMTLEPMPPNERRIIHIALRDDDTVRTESVGLGEHRRVTIIPQKTR